MSLTPAQEAAIRARNRELLVSAAAGSGKTRVLIERIYTMLKEDGLSLDRLLVVTFTHAAAAEMRERLQARMAEAAATDARMRRQAELLETAQISTLHSFCQKLVRTYFQAVEIDPQAMLGDEALCANLLLQAQGEALDWLYEQAAAGDAECAALTAKFDEPAVARMLDDLYPFLMSLPDPFGWLQANAEKSYGEQDLLEGEMARTLLADCRLLLSGAEELAGQIAALADDPLCPGALAVCARADREAVATLSACLPRGLPGVIEGVAQFSLQRFPTVRNPEGRAAEIRDQHRELRDRLKKLVASVAEHLPERPDVAIERLNAMQPSLRALARTAQRMDEGYATLKRDRTLMDFHDLERFALEILRDPAIRDEVASRFDGVFVDEYQDISGVQEAILDAVRRDVSRETSGAPQRYFYVGDVKQSIYRFRQADPTLFMEKARVFSADENAGRRKITLNRNFRSRTAVLDGVNRVFERVMRADVTEIEYDAEARLYPGEPSAGDPPVSLHLFTQPVRAADRARLEAYAIGREILRRVGTPLTGRDGLPAGTLSYRDIAILGPKMKDVSGVLERTLTEMGIPVYCEDRGSAMESEEIAQALNHLRLMDNIADDLSLIACLKSPAVGMDERDLAEIRLHTPLGSYLDAVIAEAGRGGSLGERCAAALAELRHERFLLMETPLDQYLWGWLNRSGMYAFYGCQPNGSLRQANLRMLCQKAGEHVQRRGGGLRDFLDGTVARAGVRDSVSPTVLSPWEDVVRVMTIHKSKGLEFPVVFVMGLGESFSRRRGSGLARHPRLGVALPYVNELARTTGDTMLRNAIDLRAQSEEKAERARLLYVAMTRAREELILLGCGNALRPEDAADGFRRTRGRSAYDVFAAGSMLAWVCQCVGENDAVSLFHEEEVSDSSLRRNTPEAALSTQSTINPQKNGSWNVVFHSDAAELQVAQRFARGSRGPGDQDRRRARLQALAEDARTAGRRRRAESAPDAEPMFSGASQPSGAEANLRVGADPLAPAPAIRSRPFKVGATALARAEREAAQATVGLLYGEDADASDCESVDRKRLPLPLIRPRMMADLPAMPAFLSPPPEQTGLRRGVATHKALSMIAYEPLRRSVSDPAALRAEVAAQVRALAASRRLAAEEASLVDPESLARFLESPWGRQALAAETVRREWSFNLRLPEREGLIVQGVIDLCYLWQGQWMLVDYKTDAVTDAEALWTLYGWQIALYRRALVEATGVAVHSAALFSLSLGRGAAHEDEML